MKPFDQFWGALAGGFVWYCLGVYHQSAVSIVGLSGEDCIFGDPGHEIIPTGWDSTLDCIFSNSSWIITVTSFQRILNTILSCALPTLKRTDTNWITSSYIQLVCSIDPYHIHASDVLMCTSTTCATFSMLIFFSSLLLAPLINFLPPCISEVWASQNQSTYNCWWMNSG